MSKIAFGTFRLSIENYEHYNALKLALDIYKVRNKIVWH